MQESIAALATNVRSLRESHGLSLAQLAERSGAAKATLFKIEQQRTNPTLETLMALARTFSVTVGDLLAVRKRPGLADHLCDLLRGRRGDLVARAPAPHARRDARPGRLPGPALALGSLGSAFGRGE